MLLGSQWYILYNTISGTMSISEDLIDVKQLFNIRGLILWKEIIIPAIAPQLITGIITAAGGAWNASIVAEYVLYKNKITALLGPSGSGKSTLIKIIAGLQKPTSGEVIFLCKPLIAPDPKISIVFQNFALFPWLTVSLPTT